MSKYTTEVRYICETAAGLRESEGYNSVEEILDKSWENIFSFPFPLFDNDYRSILCKKILKHYYTREIGLETAGLWKLKLDTKMNEIMPYYNQLYDSALLEFEPFIDADYIRDHKGKGTLDGTDDNIGTIKDDGSRTGSVKDDNRRNGTSNTTGSHQTSETDWDVYSDTPQGALTNVANETYLTNARKITKNESGTNSEQNVYEERNQNNRIYDEQNDNLRTTDMRNLRSYKNTDEFLEHIKGKMPGKSYSKMLQEFRETFLNIDMMIIDELGDLFMKIW